MATIKLLPKSPPSTDPYPAMRYVDWNNAVVTATVITSPGKPDCAMVLGSEMVRIGSDKMYFAPGALYMYGDFVVLS
jgi:hypothetical protein